MKNVVYSEIEEYKSFLMMGDEDATADSSSDKDDTDEDEDDEEEEDEDAPEVPTLKEEEPQTSEK